MSASAPASVIERRKRAMRAVVAAQLEDLLDDGAVLALELGGARSAAGPRRAAPRPRRAAVRARRCAPRRRRRGGGPRARPRGRRRAAASRSPTSATVPTDAYSPSCCGHEQHALLVADVDGQRDRHVREDDGVFQWDQQQGAQGDVSSTSRELGAETRLGEAIIPSRPGCPRLFSAGPAPID